jgi:hypothetical protein
MRRKTYPAGVRYTIRPESGGNGVIHDRSGAAVAVLEDWSLFIDGERVSEVDNYRSAIELVETKLGKRT